MGFAAEEKHDNYVLCVYDPLFQQHCIDTHLSWYLQSRN